MDLSRLLGTLHEKTAKWINKLDATPARKVWHNYRETRLTYEKSYLARLNYTHQNAVKHRLVPVAHQYPWCSARWFERTATPAQIKAIYRFKTDGLKLRMISRSRPTGNILDCAGRAQRRRRFRMGRGVRWSGAGPSKKRCGAALPAAVQNNDRSEGLRASR